MKNEIKPQNYFAIKRWPKKTFATSLSYTIIRCTRFVPDSSSQKARAWRSARGGFLLPSARCALFLFVGFW